MNDITFNVKTHYDSKGQEHKEYFINDKLVTEKAYKALCSEYGMQEAQIEPSIIVVDSEGEKEDLERVREIAVTLVEMSEDQRLKAIYDLITASYFAGVADTYDDIGTECLRRASKVDTQLDGNV